MRLFNVLTLALCLVGFVGCGGGSGEKAALTPEQKEIIKNGESSFATLQANMEKDVADMQKSTNTEVKNIGDQLQAAIEDSKQKLNALKQTDARTFEQKRADFAKAMKNLQTRLDEAAMNVRSLAGQAKNK